VKHEPEKMLLTEKWPRKYTGNTGRRWNVWHGTWRCRCGKEKRALTNPMKGRYYICDGETTKVLRRAPASQPDGGAK
jgi:hypothetical protein